MFAMWDVHMHFPRTGSCKLWAWLCFFRRFTLPILLKHVLFLGGKLETSGVSRGRTRWNEKWLEKKKWRDGIRGVDAGARGSIPPVLGAVPEIIPRVSDVLMCLQQVLCVRRFPPVCYAWPCQVFAASLGRERSGDVRREWKKVSFKFLIQNPTEQFVNMFINSQDEQGPKLRFTKAVLSKSYRF